MTSYVVIDASFAFKLLTPNPLREQLKQLVRQWISEEYVLCAPHLWLYEMTSILSKMMYFGEMDEEDARESLGLALDLGVQMLPPDEDQVQKAFSRTSLQLPVKHSGASIMPVESLAWANWFLKLKPCNELSLPIDRPNFF